MHTKQSKECQHQHIHQDLLHMPHLLCYYIYFITLLHILLIKLSQE